MERMFIKLLAAMLLIACAAIEAGQAVETGDSVADIPIVSASVRNPKPISNPCPRLEMPLPKRYMIMWNDGPGIDGDFALVIHPTQLFVRTFHNNPNPDAVFWLEDLSRDQYFELIVYLDTYAGTRFASEVGAKYPGYRLFHLNDAVTGAYFPEGMPDTKKLSAWRHQFDTTIEINIRRILSELNRGVTTERKLKLNVRLLPLDRRVPIEDD